MARPCAKLIQPERAMSRQRKHQPGHGLHESDGAYLRQGESAFSAWASRAPGQSIGAQTMDSAKPERIPVQQAAKVREACHRGMGSLRVRSQSYRGVQLTPHRLHAASAPWASAVASSPTCSAVGLHMDAWAAA